MLIERKPCSGQNGKKINRPEHSILPECSCSDQTRTSPDIFNLSNSEISLAAERLSVNTKGIFVLELRNLLFTTLREDSEDEEDSVAEEEEKDTIEKENESSEEENEIKEETEEYRMRG